MANQQGLIMFPFKKYMGFTSLYDFISFIFSFIALLLKSGVKLKHTFFLVVIKCNAKIRSVCMFACVWVPNSLYSKHLKYFI